MDVDEALLAQTLDALSPPAMRSTGKGCRRSGVDPSYFGDFRRSRHRENHHRRRAAGGVDSDNPATALPHPTGGADRESGGAIDGIVGRGARRLPLTDEQKALLPTEASTLHRLLGAQPSSQRMRYHAGNPLHLDVLVVDEASMIDLPMMARLIDALPEHGRVIFLGDRRSAGVGGGRSGTRGYLCWVNAGYTAGRAAQLERLTGHPVPAGESDVAGALRDSLCLLQKKLSFWQSFRHR